MCVAEIKMSVTGRFRIEKFKTDTDGNEINDSRTVAADWFDNLILDQGLNLLATSATYLNACQVGAGSTPPAATQTALTSYIAGTTTVQSSISTNASDAPYYVSSRRTFRFAQGVATGNLSELGVGTSASGATLFSRALIRDAQGNPTTLSVLSDESLDVIYDLRYYAPEEDITGTIIATGNIGGEYDYIIRPASVNVAGWWVLPQAQTHSGASGNGGHHAYTTAISTPTGRPSGTANPVDIPTSAAYVSNTFALDRIITAQLNQANLTPGIRSMSLLLGVGYYQIQFDPPIPKTAEDVVQLTLRLSWGRRP